jgi:hypothetical protein
METKVGDKAEQFYRDDPRPLDDRRALVWEFLANECQRFFFISQ